MSTLSFGGQQQSGLSFLAGTFVNVVRITEAHDISKQDIFNNGKPIDCGISIRIDVGRDFQPEMRIHGNFKPDGKGGLGWGSAFVVKDFFSQLSIEGNLTEDGHIPEESLQQLIGKQFIRLSYVRDYDANAQKKRYGDYKQIAVVKDFQDEASVKNAGQRLTNRFLKDVTAGWVKNFRPDAGNSEPTFP